jgi:isopenicillin N synthase-like dioxygenase
MPSLPLADMAPVLAGGPIEPLASDIDEACRDVGFFYLAGHGVDPKLIEQLDSLARRFFALPELEKSQVAMPKGGRAWRGWFPLGGELTSGVPDQKEGFYFGAELDGTDPRVLGGVPMHGPNLFPREPGELRRAVLAYIAEMTRVGQTVLRAMGVALCLGESWFAENLTYDPLILFRIFRYPPIDDARSWSVGEHTDYGLLTLLAQDSSGGLQVRISDGWIDIPPIDGTLVCNLGDMLERLTAGAYRSTPHRVLNTADHDRLSFPFFLDPSWDASVTPLDRREPVKGDSSSRWDGASVHDSAGTYEEYILKKVGKVFPDLAADQMS